MRGIVRWSLQYRLVVAACAAAMAVFGVVQLRNAPVDALPEFAPTIVEIQTEALGLSATEVEKLITLNLEDFLHGTSGVESIQSRSVAGLSSIVLVFRPGTDIVRARQLVQERLTVASFLPRVSKPPTMLQPLSATSRAMMIGLSSAQLSDVELSVLARWKIRPALMGVPGVANVAIWGQRRRQLQVRIDPERMRAHNVGLDRAVATSGNTLWFSPLLYLSSSYPAAGGWVDTPQQRLGIRHVLPISTAGDLATVAAEAPALNLGDLAEVVESHPLLIGDAVLPGGGGLVLVVEKFPGGNTLDVTRRVEAALQTLRPALGGIEIDATVYRPATYMEQAMGNLGTVSLIASALLILGLLAMFVQWRAVVISLVAVPLSLLAAVLVLQLRGATFNALALGGLALALVVLIDDAIADVHNIIRRLRELRADGTGPSIAEVVLGAAPEVRGPAMFATIIIGLAALPLLVIEGAVRPLYQSLALAYLLAVVASMVVALTVTPVLASMLFSNARADRGESSLVVRLRQSYDRVLRRALANPRAMYAVAGVLVVAGLGLVPFLGRAPLPAFKENSVLVQWEGAPGTSQPEMSRIAARASDELRTIPGVRNVNAHVGRAVLGDQVVGISSGQLWVSLEDGANHDATVSAIRETMAGYPGIQRDVQTYLDAAVQRRMAGSTDDIVVRVYGPDFAVLEQTAEQVRQSLSQIDGIADLRTDRPPAELQVEIKVDLAKAERYGLKPGDIRRAAATQVSGLEVGSLYEEQKVFDVVVWVVPRARNSPVSIRELLIDTPTGGRVRLGDVAEVRMAPAPALIRHEANSRHIDVKANVRGRDVGAVTGDLRQHLQSSRFPFEYHAELVDDSAERRAEQQRLLIAGLVSAAGIFLLLQAAFDSWRLATLVFVALPVALVGSLIAVVISGGTLLLGSLAGFLAVLGIAARHAVMLVCHYQRLTRDGEPFGLGLAVRGVQDRFAPVLATTIVAGAVLVPIIVAGNRAGFEIAHPVAIVVLGGLITSMLVNLLVIPALYLQFASPRSAEQGAEVRGLEPGALQA